ncbi:MAG: hypothetical protein ACYTGZ_14245 [Planctomycetota bacterium]
MRRWVLGALISLAACASQSDDLGLLELETLRFKASNEQIRVDDLLARYEKRRRRADALSKQLLALQQEREEAYGDYDRLRGDLVRVERERAEAERERQAAAAALAKAQRETKRLAAELKKERDALAKLQAELEQVRAKVRAMEAQKANVEQPAE